MDILTQGLLGGVLAQTLARRSETKIATLAGVVAGVLADADVLIRSSSDPLLTIEYHRHFSHALVFVPLGALLAALLLWPLLRRRLAPGRLYVFCLAGYSMSGVLDACTSYGTQLFWPFSDQRLALNIISIIDPIFTLALLLSLISGFYLRRRGPALAGLLFCLAYLGFGYMQLQRAEALAARLPILRGHKVLQSVVKPTLGNLLLWRSVYMDRETIYVDALRVGLFSADRIYEGESLPRFVTTSQLPDLATDSRLYRDIQRFMRFSNDFVAVNPRRADVLGDIRYSMLPVSAAPLWGIIIDPAQPEQHADYRFFREQDQETRRIFINLLLGRDHP